MKPKISVIIVTFNRSSLLKKCIESILNQSFFNNFEIILINNGSSDNTENLIMGEFEKSVRYIKTPKRTALNACKNLGIQSASGDIIAFIDDDCIACDNWLDTIDTSIVDYDFIGGSVSPIPNTEFPWWWNNSLNWLIGINPKPDIKFPPLGSNIAFKRNAVDKLKTKNNTGFSPLPYVEDYYRFKESMKTGLSMNIDTDMSIYHHVPSERLKIKYLIKRSFAEGRAWVEFDKNAGLLFIFLLKLFTNPIKFILCADTNYLFREIVSIGYILNYIK